MIGHKSCLSGSQKICKLSVLVIPIETASLLHYVLVALQHQRLRRLHGEFLLRSIREHQLLLLHGISMGVEVIFIEGASDEDLS